MGRSSTVSPVDERGAPDGRHRRTVRVRHAIASDRRIVCLFSGDDQIARTAAVNRHAPQPPAADAIAGVEQVLPVASPGDAAYAAIVERQAAHRPARGVAKENIGAVVLRVPHERDAAAARRDSRAGVAFAALGWIGDALHLARIQRDHRESGRLLLAALHHHQRFAIGIPGDGGHRLSRIGGRPEFGNLALRSAIGRNHDALRVPVFHPQEGQRTAIRRPHRRHVAALSLGQLLRFAGRQLAHEDVKRAHLGTLARAVRHSLAVGRNRRVRLGFLARGKLHPLLRHLRSGGQPPHQRSPAPPPNKAPAPT